MAPAARARSDEARGQASFVRGQESSKNSAHCADVSDERKLLEKPRTRDALTGRGPHELASGGFVLTRRNVVRELPSLQAVKGAPALEKVHAAPVAPPGRMREVQP